MTIPTDRLEYVRVEKEVLRVAADALDIAADWNLDDLQVSPPATWGLADPDEPEHAAEGWVSARALAQHFRSLAAAPSPPAEPVAWLIAWKGKDQAFRAVQFHNAIADYRDFDPKATSTPLYAAPPPDRLAELTHQLEVLANRWDETKVIDLRAADDLRAIVAKYNRQPRDSAEGEKT